MNSKPVYVAGLTHSGSTLLDMILGAHPNLVGLGEIFPLVTSSYFKLKEEDRRCSCGDLLSDCPLWGPATRRLFQRDSASPEERYQILLDSVREVYGAETRLVDSSKSIGGLRLAHRVAGGRLAVLHLIRDVRSWAVSRRDTDLRKGRYTAPDLFRVHRHGAWRPLLQRNSIAHFLIWYRGNRKIQRATGSLQLPVHRVIYEQLALNPARTVSALCEFLEVDFDPRMIDPSESRSHVALGNYMRLSSSRGRKISYDQRWFYRREWELPALLLPHVMKYNRSVTLAENRRDPAVTSQLAI